MRNVIRRADDSKSIQLKSAPFFAAYLQKQLFFSLMLLARLRRQPKRRTERVFDFNFLGRTRSLTRLVRGCFLHFSCFFNCICSYSKLNCCSEWHFFFLAKTQHRPDIDLISTSQFIRNCVSARNESYH